MLADPLLRSDPGLARTRTAVNTLVSLAGAIAGVLVLGEALGRSGRELLVGVVIAALACVFGSLAMLRSPPGALVRTGVVTWAGAGVGVLVGTGSAEAGPGVRVASIVVLTFVVAWARRFGPLWTGAGQVAWVLSLISGVLAGPLGQAPALIGNVALAYAWLVVSARFFRASPRRVLRWSLLGVRLRTLAVLERCARVLGGGGDRSVRALARAGDALTDAVAAVDSQLDTTRPGQESADLTRERARLVDAQVAAEEIASASRSLAGPARVGAATDTTADARLLAAATAVVTGLGGDAERARASVGALATASRARGGSGPSAPGTLMVGAAQVLGPYLRREVRAVDLADPPQHVAPTGPPPSAAAVASSVTPRGGRWNPLAALSPGTRQAVQVTVAVAITIAVGQLLSERYYVWGLIAAFTIFSNTSTGAETSARGAGRVVGALAGIALGFVVEQWLGSGLVVVVVATLATFPLALALQQVSYTGSNVLMSLPLPILYDAAHRPLESTLVLRLELTVIGAGIGVAVALLLSPTGARAVLRRAEDAFGQALATFLEACAQVLEDPSARAGARLDVLAKTVEARLGEASAAAQPSGEPLLPVATPAAVRRRLFCFRAQASAARALASALRASPVDRAGAGDLATVCRRLAGGARAGAAEGWSEDGSGGGSRRPPGERDTWPASLAADALVDQDARARTAASRVEWQLRRIDVAMQRLHAAQGSADAATPRSPDRVTA